MKIRIAILLILIFLGEGLNNYRELKDLAILTTIAVDKEDENYLVTAQIINPTKEKNEIIVYEQRDKTIHKAIRKMIYDSPKKLFASHMQLIVVSEDIAKNGIKEIMDFFTKDSEISTDTNIVIAKGKAAELLTIKTPIVTDPSLNLVESIKASEKFQGTITSVEITEMLDFLLNDNKELILPSAIVIENEFYVEENYEKTILVSNMGYFKDDKLIGYLEEDDNMAYNFLNNNIKNAVIDCDESTIEVMASNTSVKVKQNEVKFKIDATANLTNLVGDSTPEKIDENFKNRITEMLKNFVKNTKDKYNVDIINLNNYMYLNNYKKSEDFRDINVVIEVDIKIESEGEFISDN